MATLASFAAAPQPATQITTGSQQWDPVLEQWTGETGIADWAKPYVHADGSYKGYQELKNEGLWDLTNPNLLRYFDSLSTTGGTSMGEMGALGDWRTSPGAQNTLFARLGLTTADSLLQPAFQGTFTDPREAFGDLFNYDAVEQARAQQVKSSEDSSGFGDNLEFFVKEVGQNFVLPALAAYTGVNALGGLTGAGAAAPAAEAASAGGGLASLTGPATGAIEAAPVIGAGGAPTITAVASGAGPFVPVVGGATGLSNLISQGIDSASGGGSTALAPGAGAPTTTLERLLAAGLPAALGYIGSDQQADALQALADRQFAVGAPSRERFEASFAPGFGVGSLPGVQSSMDVATETLLRKLSASGGNPWGNPGGLTEAMNYVTGNVALPALNEYRRLNAGTGGLAALTSGAPQTATASIGADANRWNAIGAGAADFFYPPKRVSLSDILKAGLS